LIFCPMMVAVESAAFFGISPPNLRSQKSGIGRKTESVI
jgi:hypothetical protein